MIGDWPKFFFFFFCLFIHVKSGVLHRGLTVAVLKQTGTVPVVRDQVFVILVMTGARTSRHCLVRGVGTEAR